MEGPNIPNILELQYDFLDLLGDSDNESIHSDDPEPSDNELELDPIEAFQNAELLLENVGNEVRLVIICETI